MRIFRGSIFARFYSHVAGRLPSWLRDKVQDSISKYPADAVFKYRGKYIESSALMISDELSKKAAQGCEESKKFSSAIEEFRDPKNTTLLVENFPKDVRSVSFLSHIIAIFFNPKLRVTDSLFAKTTLSKAKDISPHSDGSHNNSVLPITSVGGILSDGSTKNGFSNASEIEKNLSEMTKEILKIKAFRYLEANPLEVNNKSSFQMPILYYNEEDGSLNINFFLEEGMRLFYDEEKIPYLEEEIEAAINELHEVVNNLEGSEKTKLFGIKSGQTLFMKNKHGVHFVKFPKLAKSVAPDHPKEEAEPNEKSHRYVVVNSYKQVSEPHTKSKIS